MLVGQPITDVALKRNIMASIPYRCPSGFNASQLQKHPHLACMRSHGTAMYMFLLSHENMNVCVFIEKHVSPNHELPRMVSAPFQMHWSLFLNGGTLLDGEMAKSSEGRSVFLVNDVMCLCGQSTFHDPLPSRLQSLQDCLTRFYKPSIVDTCTIEVKKYVAANDGDFTRIASDIASVYPSRAILFKPVMSMKLKDMQHTLPSTAPRVSCTPRAKLNTGFVASLSDKAVLPVTKIGLDRYKSRNAEVLARTLVASLKMQELFAGMPVNRPMHVPCKWSKNFNAWEVVIA